uniref:Vacuolar fusion protein CCZ1 n=2 Tax=Lygus hesperus TaxID=30085 RepID=A0A0A9XQP9_LYGHE
MFWRAMITWEATWRPPCTKQFSSKPTPPHASSLVLFSPFWTLRTETRLSSRRSSMTSSNGTSLDLRLAECDILNVFDGVQFLPLDRTTFLRSQCFVNLVEATFPTVSHSLLLYDSNLVWSGLNPEDVQVVYRYVCNSLLPKHLKANYLAKSAGSNARLSRFVTGPDCLVDMVYSDKTPKVYLDKIQRPGFFHLIVYKVQDLVICLFLPKNKDPLRLELYRQLDAFLYERMSELITEIKSYKKSTPEPPEAPDTRYVYFNTMNLATKDSLRERKGNPSSDALVRALVRLHNHNVNLSKEGCLSSETFMRMSTDHWVIGRMSNFRQFYIAVERKKLSLQEVDDVAKRICENKLKGIFFHV